MNNYLHKELLENNKWYEKDIAEKIGNIGSEISRALKWKSSTSENSKENYMLSFYRALDLIDITLRKENNLTSTQVKELCRFRELWVDYFVGDNIYKGDDKFFKSYTDSFAIYSYIQKQNSN